MSEKPDGGAAFLTGATGEHWENRDGEKRLSLEFVGGMSLRDYFAAKAMAALAGNEAYVAFLRGFYGANTDGVRGVPTQCTESMTREAYRIADAMIAERDK